MEGRKVVGVRGVEGRKVVGVRGVEGRKVVGVRGVVSSFQYMIRSDFLGSVS